MDALLSFARCSAAFFSSCATIFEYAACVSSRKMERTAASGAESCSKDASDCRHVEMRSAESSSMGTATNCD
jgi:hypothetical protein